MHPEAFLSTIKIAEKSQGFLSLDVHNNKARCNTQNGLLTTCAQRIQETTDGRAVLRLAGLTVGHNVAARVSSMKSTAALRYANQFRTIVGGGPTSRQLAKSNRRVQDHPNSNRGVQDHPNSNQRVQQDHPNSNRRVQDHPNSNQML
jgi:hypothetical protein